MKAARLTLIALTLTLIASTAWAQCTVDPLNKVANCSFETDALADGAFTTSPTSWTVSGSAGAFDPAAPDDALPTDGTQFGFSNNGASLRQNFDTMTTGLTYDATLDVCVRTGRTPTASTVELWNTTDNVMLASTAVTLPSAGTCTTGVTVSHVAGASDSGDTVQVRLNATGDQVNFDNVVGTPVELMTFSID